MKKEKVVFDSPGMQDYISLKRYVRQNIPVYIVEPFHTYHHKKGMRFFPPHLPQYVLKLLSAGKIKFITASELNANEMYFLSADKAVAVIESVFSEYRKGHAELFDYVSETLKSPAAEDVFKKELCDRLAEFYSANILISRVNKLLGNGEIIFYPDSNVCDYNYLKGLLLRSKQEFFEHPDVRFPLQRRLAAYFENLREYCASLSILSAQTFASLLLGIRRPAGAQARKNYTYGVAVISPSRQLAGNGRGPDFIIDNNKISAEEVVYLPLAGLTDEQKKSLEHIPGSVHYLPKAGRFFSHPARWSKLLRISISDNLMRNGPEIRAATKAFFSYFRWTSVLDEIQLRHFITHCDFGVNHIGRNLALSQAGVQTWYFTDSMNSGCNLITDKDKCGMRHPFWAFFHYDHFVTWDKFLAGYFKEHPGSIRQSHIVGCLWSEHIKEKEGENFVVAAFDTTYTRNGFTAYAEGIVFAEHLLELVNDVPGVSLIIKEKKNREMHRSLDPVLGPRLLDLYKEMDRHPGITTCSEGEDASGVISVADMVISFPFTSTTFEALSINKPAIWHDPLGYYIRTPYAKAGGVTTHSYDELKLKIREIKSMGRGVYRNPFPKDSPLMDPHRDGRAIGRFRELLTSPKA